jgi:hypothetical protein
VFTGRAMFVWGGLSSDRSTRPATVVRHDTGGLYDPERDRWAPIEPLGAPSPRNEHALVWTGAEALVWGGAGTLLRLSSGGRFQP